MSDRKPTWSNSFCTIVAVGILSGCSSAAVKVTEIEGECVFAGALFAPTILEQAPPEVDVDFRFEYQGARCSVQVMGPTE